VKVPSGCPESKDPPEPEPEWFEPEPEEWFEPEELPDGWLDPKDWPEGGLFWSPDG
jgi:hypothetical protein